MEHSDRESTHIFRRRMTARENSLGGLLSLVTIGAISVWLAYSSKTNDAASAPAPAAPPAARAQSAAPPTTDAAANATPAAPPAAVPAAALPKKVSFAATHKHLHDCHGVLSFTPRSVVYRTTETNDSFEYSIDAVSLDKDGFEAKGKPWHFKIPGQDVDRLFARWKAGTLFDDPPSRGR